jgi:hypothetical protein
VKEWWIKPDKDAPPQTSTRDYLLNVKIKCSAAVGASDMISFRYGVVANIIASHAIALGSIPSIGDFLSQLMGFGFTSVAARASHNLREAPIDSLYNIKCTWYIRTIDLEPVNTPN